MQRSLKGAGSAARPIVHDPITACQYRLGLAGVRGRVDAGHPDVFTRSGQCVQFFGPCVNFAGPCVNFAGRCVQFSGSCVQFRPTPRPVGLVACEGRRVLAAFGVSVLAVKGFLGHGRRLLGPGRASAGDGVDVQQQLAHERDQGDFARLPALPQTAIEALKALRGRRDVVRLGPPQTLDRLTMNGRGGARRAGASRGRGWRVPALTSMPAMQSVHALLALQAGVWLDSGRRGRRPGSPRTGAGRVLPGPRPPARPSHLHMIPSVEYSSRMPWEVEDTDEFGEWWRRSRRTTTGSMRSSRPWPTTSTTSTWRNCERRG